MSVITLTTPDDPRTADYAHLSDPALARRQRLFVAEGRLVVRRALQDGRFVFRSLLLSEAARQQLEPELQTLDPTVPIYLAPATDFAHITGVNIHRGCLALLERPQSASVAEVLRTSRTVVVLEGVANADNVGGVFRNVRALGGDGVLLSPNCCDPLYRKAIRTSMGAALTVPFARCSRWPEDLLNLSDFGFTTVALSPDSSAMSLDEFLAVQTYSRIGRLALMIGTEGEGLSDAASTRAAFRVRIPMRAGVDSLNLAVAAGIALHRLALPTRPSGL
jgi:tRNA G18 (ribose-2'-O)-methylase SpoU